MNFRHLCLGCAAWVGALVAAWLAARQELQRTQHSVASLVGSVGQWAVDRRTPYVAAAQSTVALAVGDPVLLRQSDGSYRQVGVVRDNSCPDRRQVLTRRVTVSIYDDAAAEFPRGFQLRYHATPTSLNWVAETLITDERRQQIAQLIAADWQRHQVEVLQNLTPVIQSALQKSIAAIEAELPAIIEEHRSQFTQLGERYQAEIVRQQVLPLARERILPIVEEEIRPLAGDIGRRLWNRVSLWSFTWRYFYDVSPLPERNAVRQEFDRFLEEEALPELRAHTDEYVAVTERIVSRVARDPQVTATIRRSLRMVASDPQLHAIVWSILRQAVADNQTLWHTLDEHWRSPEARRALQLASSRFEPAARAIGDLIIGSREQGVTPEFAQVLRAQILLKDRHWLILEAAPEATPGDVIAIVPGPTAMSYPLTPDSGGSKSSLSPLQ